MKKQHDSFQINPFRPDLTSQVAALNLDIQRHEFGIAITLDDQPDLSAIPTVYQAAKGNFWCALANGRVPDFLRMAVDDRFMQRTLDCGF